MIAIPSSSDLYDQYKEQMRRVADIRYASAVLQWDQETYLPPKGATIRGQQVATLSEAAHQLFIAPALGILLEELSSRNDLSPGQKININRTREDYLKQKKFSSLFVRQLAEATQKSFHSWIQARTQNEFSIFEPDLSSLIGLKKEEAERLGYSKHPYDALLNDHDKGSSIHQLDDLFSAIYQPLKKLLEKIMACPPVNDRFLHQHFPKQQQWDFGMQVLKDFGFDLGAGRQDEAEHPFTINFNSQDVRITTRIDEQDLAVMIWSTIHEMGHALYEQGLPETEYGLPMGEPTSFSIHESQSRLWENHVGRSNTFCERYLPLLKQYFPKQLNDVSVSDFYKGINKIQPSLIRTEADELTYHFHIIIRYEIEKKLIEGSIQSKDIPSYWNEHYRDYLDLIVPDDKLGCLQDVHWCHGSFGYFPTYSTGSLYAAQFYATAIEKNPSLEDQIVKGNKTELLKWLQTEVYQHGRSFTSEELCLRISGKGLNPHYFLVYLLAKYSNIHHF